MKRLVIDLGHGGKDSGAVGKNKTKESDVVLSIGKYLEEMLKDIDLELKFTRISDKYVSLSERVKIANDFKGDYFLSIHINSCGDKSVRGVEVWQYSDGDKNLNNFCKYLCDGISSIFKIRNRGVKISKNLYVLKNTSIKSALLEVDFISNEYCENDLNNDKNIKEVSKVIRDGILRLYGISEEMLYRVCIGSYKYKSNAVSIMNRAKENGFSDAYII